MRDRKDTETQSSPVKRRQRREGCIHKPRDARGWETGVGQTPPGSWKEPSLFTPRPQTSDRRNLFSDRPACGTLLQKGTPTASRSELPAAHGDPF